MALTSLIIAIVAALFAGASAVYARRQSQSAQGMRRIEEDRRLDELTPQINCTMEVGPGTTYRIAVTLESQRPLTSCRVWILDDRVSFQEPRAKSLADPGDPRAEFGPLEPGIIATKPAFVHNYCPDAVVTRIECEGAHGQRWTLTKTLEIPPPPPG